jgi:hypothetical protein
VNLGDVVVFAGRRFLLRGVDPTSVRPRLAYLEEWATGRSLTVPFDRVSDAVRPSTPRLRPVVAARRSAV